MWRRNGFTSAAELVEVTGVATHACENMNAFRAGALGQLDVANGWMPVAYQTST